MLSQVFIVFYIYKPNTVEIVQWSFFPFLSFWEKAARLGNNMCNNIQG